MGNCPDTDIDPFQIGCHGKIQKAKMEKEKRKTQEQKREKIGKRKRRKWELIRQI